MNDNIFYKCCQTFGWKVNIEMTLNDPYRSAILFVAPVS